VLACLLFWPLSATLHLSLRLQAQTQESKPAQEASRPGTSEHEQRVETNEPEPTDELRHSTAVRFIARLLFPGAQTKEQQEAALNKAFWLCVILNFVVVFIVLWIPMRKKLPVLFKNRTESIQKGIEEARKTSEEARRRLAEVEGRLSRLDAEIAQMRREAEENARSEEKRMGAEVEAERQRIVAAAEQEIAMAAGAARRELKSYAAELAVDLAEKKIRVASDADQALVREFTASLGRDGN
jgi:F-type H+-transporting ATPase subunit b